MKRTVKVCLAVMLAWMFIPLFCACNHAKTAYAKYEVTAEYDPAHQLLTGVVKLTFVNPTDNALSIIKMQVYPNAYREYALYSPIGIAEETLAYYDGKSYGGINVTSVSGAKSWTIAGEDENILDITLPYALYPDESVVLDVGFTVALPRVNHRFGVGQTAVHLGRFFPVLCGIQNGGFVETLSTAVGEPYFLAVADYKVHVTTPKEYFALSSCEKVDEQMLESKTEHRFAGNNIRNFGLVLYGQRNAIEMQVGDCTITYAYQKDDNVETTRKLIQEAFLYCQNLFGSYPYPTFSIFQTEQSGESYGYTGLITMAKRLTGKALHRAIVRQIAKQWFGEIVGVDTIHNAWQSDGVAEYVALTFFDEHKGYGLEKEKLLTEYWKEYRSYYDVYGNVLGRTDTKMTKPLTAFINEYEYRCLSIDKAVIMLDTLQKSIGERRLLAGLKRYMTTYAFCQTGVGELVGSLEKYGADVQGFFDGFLQGKVVL